MPLIINPQDLNNDTAPVVHTPKFFHPTLTGNGGGMGVVNAQVIPENIGDSHPVGDRTAPLHRGENEDDTDTRTIKHFPLAPIHESMYDTYYAGKDTGLLRLLGDRPLTRLGLAQNITMLRKDRTLALRMRPVMAYLSERPGDTAGKTLRQVMLRYHMEVLDNDGAPFPDDLEPVMQAHSILSESRFTDNPLVTWKSQMNLLADTGMAQDVQDWIAQYNGYDQICEIARIWAEGDVVTETIDLIDTALAANPQVFENQQALRMLAAQMTYLNNYPLELNQYHKLYEKLIDIFDTGDTLQFLCKSNMSLMLANELAELNSVRDQLAVAISQTGHQLPDYYSHEQAAAITAAGPLNMILAGAGTGKSTVVGGRINYLDIACGVNKNHIQVLSFTNAAADNITARYPGVLSQTIAKMIQEIYQISHPTHAVSDLETILNAIQAKRALKNDPKAEAFSSRLRHLIKAYNSRGRNSQDGALVNLSNHIENDFTDVIRVLDTIGQTSLELQHIICKINLENMPLPNNDLKFLIIDEVQDTSIFEFVFLLKYAKKMKLNVFMVGDGSQTLYEFRAADPRAMGSLEESGYFDTYPLTTNYRSSQEILNMANTLLTDIAANQHAKIQLHSNLLKAVTPESFQEAVSVVFEQGDMKVNGDTLQTFFRTNVYEYVRNALDRDEEVAFLAHSRAHALAMKENLEIMFPGTLVVSLMSDRPNTMTVFSQFVSKYSNLYESEDPARAMFIADDQIRKRMDTMVRNVEALQPMVDRMLSEWRQASQSYIDQLVQGTVTGYISRERFFELFSDTLINYEIAFNAKRKRAISTRNETERAKNNEMAKLKVSTVHGVKGLEFDHVVYLVDDASLSKEDAKRLSYVALSRAMKSEKILTYSKHRPVSVLKDRYESVVRTLENQQQMQQAADDATDPTLDPVPQTTAPSTAQHTPDPVTTPDSSDQQTPDTWDGSFQDVPLPMDMSQILGAIASGQVQAQTPFEEQAPDTDETDAVQEDQATEANETDTIDEDQAPEADEEAEPLDMAQILSALATSDQS